MIDIILSTTYITASLVALASLALLGRFLRSEKRQRSASLLFVLVPALLGVCALLVIVAWDVTELVWDESAFVFGGLLIIAICYALNMAVALNDRSLSQKTNALYSALVLLCALYAYTLVGDGLCCGRAHLQVTYTYCVHLEYFCLILYVLLFWFYASSVLEIKTKATSLITKVLCVAAVVGAVLIVLNVRMEWLFSLDGSSNYEEALVSDAFMAVLLFLDVVILVFTIITPHNRIEKSALIVMALIYPLSSIVEQFTYPLELGGAALFLAVVYSYVGISVRRSKDFMQQQSEVALASTIQQNMLPHEPPQDKRFELYANMTPAKEIAGDFYDYLIVDERYIYILVADVSGKGVAAAMFMAKAKALIHEYAKQGALPNEILGRVNMALWEENASKHFVTAWLGRYDMHAATLEFANAGHNPPVLIRGGHASLLEMKSNVVLGLRKRITYHLNALDMTENDLLVLYTDGVTEAIDASEAEFGCDRLIACVEKMSGDPCRAIVEGIEESVAAFEQGAERFDDITLLCMRFLPGKRTRADERTFPADLDELEAVTEFVRDACGGFFSQEGGVGEIDLCVEEIFVNICTYAYEDLPTSQDAQRTVRVCVEDDGSQLTFSFIDGGAPFNPLELPDPDLGAGAKRRSQGGLGIYLVKSMMDAVSYERIDERNILTLRKHYGKHYGKHYDKHYDKHYADTQQES